VSRFEILHGDDPDQPFHVRLIGDNGEPLSVTENLIDEEAAHTNIVAQAKALGWGEPRLTHGTAEPWEWVVQGGWPKDAVEVRMVDARAGSEPCS
jgi:hypothetical protein